MIEISFPGHVDELLRRGERKIAACLSWTAFANLPLTFLERIFQCNVCPSVCFFCCLTKNCLYPVAENRMPLRASDRGRTQLVGSCFRRPGKTAARKKKHVCRVCPFSPPSQWGKHKVRQKQRKGEREGEMVDEHHGSWPARDTMRHLVT